MKPVPEAPTDEMEDLYAGSMEGDKGKHPDSIDDEEREELAASATVPLSVLQSADKEPVKEGDEIMVKVKAVHGEEATIYYAPKKPEGEESGGEHEMEPNEELDKLDTY